MNIDHINIKAPAALIESLRSFYCDLFGMTDGFRPDFSFNGYWLYAGDRALIHLSESYLDHWAEGQSHLDHFAFRTSGLQEILARLKSMNINYSTGFVPETDVTQLFFKDPSGTGVEVQFIGEHIE